MSEDQKMPSILEMVKNFSRDLATYIAKGSPNVTEEDYKERVETCEVCPSFKKSASRCTTCGCLVEHKAKWKTTNCPEDKWKNQDV
jgi:hypothetical protein|tara:strand:+ start:470 stop:727 length:258 start_codon:yes stop_codon:yes gene_type:complete